MPRSSNKSIIRAEFEEVIEDVCTIVALETQNRGVSDEEDLDSEDSESESVDRRSDWRVIKDLVDIYDIFFEPRYMDSRSVSAGRHGVCLFSATPERRQVKPRLTHPTQPPLVPERTICTQRKFDMLSHWLVALVELHGYPTLRLSNKGV
ncbi:hypothetical protein L211DRAFT_900908 [Terfezia boudieri ATCC MYA-4762]|uniref:Uncharacterized protein n=1 Tax=Terfezia boudieri ATCC MYA-4762 TaxID=1051890 RepID=A0A3N4LTG2_9PEZI|nr:hypothetical protein L211DRAFT_900908 [Terfezia boudieri ATCC MYA-4762]